MNNNLHYPTPLYTALEKYCEQNKTPFHMPGHKGGRVFAAKFRDKAFKIDLTELEETDNLTEPTGCIKEAQELAANAFGAFYSHFLTGGSTCGNLAMLAYACGRGGSFIIDRNCHLSVINAMVLLNITPIYVYPQYIPHINCYGGILPEDIECILQKHPEVKGALITSPNYFGICSDLDKIAKILYKYNKLLVVDEAHGAHFAFSPLLPKTAMAQGADICVQSLHKTLPAPTGAAIIHTSGRINQKTLTDCIRLFQSSSPSYILMAYSDIARAYMQKHGEGLYKRLYKYINELKRSIPYNTLSEVGKHAIAAQDFTRLVISLEGSGITGFEAAALLNQKYNIAMEMADLNNIVAIAGAGNSRAHFQGLAYALNDIGLQKNKKHLIQIPPPPTAKFAITPANAYWAASTEVALHEAEGEIASRTVVCYPPCVPIIIAGERITREQITYIELITASGGRVIGLEFNKVFIIT